MPPTILITAANGDIAESIGAALLEGFPGIRLHGADAGGVWPGKAMFASMTTLPKAAHPSYPEALAKLGHALGADAIIPVNELELRRLAKDPGPAATLPLLMNTPTILETFTDKLATARWLQARSLPAPATMPLAEASGVDLPLVVKARCSSGSKAVHVVRSPNHLALLQAEGDGDLVAQALIDGVDREYTCAVFRWGGVLRTLAMRRSLIGGMSSRIEVVDIPAITAVLQDIAAALDLRGCINVQLRVDAEGWPWIFEINPRLSSTTYMRHSVGFSDAVWWLGGFLGTTVPHVDPPVPGTRVYRMSRAVVVPPC